MHDSPGAVMEFSC